MRIVTWNLNRATWQHRGQFTTADDHGRAAWSELARFKPDVALLQEATPPPHGLERPPSTTIPRGSDRDDWRSLPGPRRFWTTAVAAWSSDLREVPTEGRMEPLFVSQKGAWAAGIVDTPARTFAVASIYALWDYSWAPDGSKPRYAHTSLHRAISDLTPLLDCAANGMSIVLAGDFNTSTQFETPHREAFRSVHQRLTDLGLHNVAVRADGEMLAGCPCDDEICRHLQTYEGATPYQDDYVYVSTDLVDQVRLVPIERTDAVAAVSDHFPLVVEIS